MKDNAWTRFRAELHFFKMILIGKLAFLKYKWKNGLLFSGISYAPSYKSREAANYYLKVLQDENYKYTTYSEQMLYNELLEAVEKENCSLQDAAYSNIIAMIGILGPDIF